MKKRLVKIKVFPRSSRGEIVGELADGTIKIRLKAAPVDGRANEELLKFLSVSWNLPPASLRLVRGHRGRNKIVEIVG